MEVYFTYIHPLWVFLPLHLLAYLPAPIPPPFCCETPRLPCTLASYLVLLEAGWVQLSFFALLIGSHRPLAPASLSRPYNLFRTLRTHRTFLLIHPSNRAVLFD